MRLRLNKSVLVGWLLYIGVFALLFNCIIPIVIWGLLLKDELISSEQEIDWLMYLHAIPVLIQLCAFFVILAFIKTKKRIATYVLLFTLLFSVGAFCFDTCGQFYQLPVYGEKYYVNWWWYNFRTINRMMKEWTVVCGFINKGGKFVIEPKFGIADSFSDGLAMVYTETSYPVNKGFIDRTGELIIEPEYYVSESFSEGLAVVGIKESGQLKYGYVDKTGKFIIEPRFKLAESFSEGLAEVYEPNNNCASFIDKNGNTVIWLEEGLEPVCPFVEGLAGLALRKEGRGFTKWGFIDKSGRFAIALQDKWEISFRDNFREGLAIVEVSDKYGFIDKTGQIVIEPRFKWAKSFSEGLAAVKIENKYGYINRKGQMVIAPQFEKANSFSEGFAAVTNGHNGKRGYRRVYDAGYIDKEGNYVFNVNSESMSMFSDGLAAVEFSDMFGLWGYVDKTGKIVIEPQFIIAHPFSEGLASVAVNKFAKEVKSQ
jgi:hypothetical protein